VMVFSIWGTAARAGGPLIFARANRELDHDLDGA